MPDFKKATGFILRKARSRENDQLVVVFTREHGKQFLYARGAQKITSKRMTALDSLNLVKVNYAQKNGFNFVREVDLVSRLDLLKTDYTKRKFILTAAELMDKLMPLNQPEEEIFLILHKFLARLGKEELSETELFSFLESLLKKMGYMLPPLTKVNWNSLNKFLQETGGQDLVSREL